ISLGLAASALTAAGWAGEVRACRTYLPVETELVDPMFRRDEIEVVREALALTCDEDASGRWPEGALRCRVRARYRLRNHGVAPVVDEGLVVVHRGEGLVVLQGGVDISEAVDPA